MCSCSVCVPGWLATALTCIQLLEKTTISPCIDRVQSPTDGLESKRLLGFAAVGCWFGGIKQRDRARPWAR